MEEEELIDEKPEELDLSNEESKAAGPNSPDTKIINRPSKRHIPPASLASWRSGKPTILHSADSKMAVNAVNKERIERITSA